MAGFFLTISPALFLERLTKNLKGAFRIFYSVLIMAPRKNSRKKKQENKIMPKQKKQENKIMPKRGDILEFPVGSRVGGRRASSWWPGM